MIRYVDDLKISHADKEVVPDIISHLQLKCGQIMTLSMSRGEVHEYLGMFFDYTTQAKSKHQSINIIMV